MQGIQRRFDAVQTRKCIRSAPGIFHVANREAAMVILADPDSHGGEQAGLVRWARAAMAHEDAAPLAPSKNPQTTLF